MGGSGSKSSGGCYKKVPDPPDEPNEWQVAHTKFASDIGEPSVDRDGPQYCVIRMDNLNKLTALVTQGRRLGWLVAGGVTQTPDGYWTQAMIRPFFKYSFANSGHWFGWRRIGPGGGGFLERNGPGYLEH